MKIVEVLLIKPFCSNWMSFL